MLEELRISNFAVIDQLELSFGAGFNVITGETGAGKSILVDAVELLLGAKADPAFVRAGAERCRIEGFITLDGSIDVNQSAITALLQRENLLDDNPGYLSIQREIRRRGRSSARVNGVAVNSALLREIGQLLFDIHGQSEHLSLFRPRHHIDLLDRYADLLDVRAGLSALVGDLTAAQGEMRLLREDKETLEGRAELLRHEIQEISAATLQPDEEATLLAERHRLANSEQLATLARECAQLLNGDDREAGAPLVDGLMQVAASLTKLAQIDADLSSERQMAEDLTQGAQDLALTITRYADEIEFDPARLDEVEERLELIRSLKRRFQATDIAGILSYAAEAATELENIDHSEERLVELRRQERTLLLQIGDISLRLSQARAEAGRELARAVMRELQELRMERTRFEARLAQAEHPAGCIVGERRYKFDGKGMDDVEFVMSANPGQPPLPLAKVASGGEAARIMLALKRVLATVDQTPILIFDEVDQGIGGRIGAVVGEKLWALSGAHQVLCVTHLPQLAAYADRHFQARKSLSDARAATEVRELLDEEARVAELAEMLGAASAAGMASARELLSAARGRKNG